MSSLKMSDVFTSLNRSEQFGPLIPQSIASCFRFRGEVFLIGMCDLEEG